MAAAAMTECVYYTRILMYGDGGGQSTQRHAVLLGPAPRADGTCPGELVDTGIVAHWCQYSAAPQGETADAQNQGPSDLRGMIEETFEFEGRYYGTLDAALRARSTR